MRISDWSSDVCSSDLDPGLKPLESKNFDLSFEWYYGEASYLSVGYFRKDIDNYIGTAQREIHPGLTTPVGGAYFLEAIANGCVEGSVGLRDRQSTRLNSSH